MNSEQLVEDAATGKLFLKVRSIGGMYASNCRGCACQTDNYGACVRLSEKYDCSYAIFIENTDEVKAKYVEQQLKWSAS